MTDTVRKSAPEVPASQFHFPDGEVQPAIDAASRFIATWKRLRDVIGKVIVGQEQVVEQTLLALFANGHVLLEGVPGLGKTLLVRTIADALSLTHARIQFTPDVMPADITGTTMVDEDHQGHRVFTFRPGPIFHQLLLADEINRATPKTQAALLEAMQERSVTVGGETRHLERPFLVLATQNPIEQEGTYGLPEAQLDRFLFKVEVPGVKRAELNEILSRTTANTTEETPVILDADGIAAAQRLARMLPIAPHVQDFAVRLVMSSHPGGPQASPQASRYVASGASPRAAQALVTAARVRALVAGRFAVAFDDVAAIAQPALRHRIVRTFEADSDGIDGDQLVTMLLEDTPRYQTEGDHRG